jgi:hypothetical protein
VLYDLTDWLVGPLKDLLASVVGWLSGISLVAARGIEPGRYLGAIAWLGPAWLGLVRTIILCTILYGTILIVRAAIQVYLDTKAGVKWW